MRRGRVYGEHLGPDYMEVHFEELIASPQRTLDQIGEFIDHRLDYERIRRVAYGSVGRPNSSFQVDASASGFNPVGRWKKSFSPAQLLRFEKMVGNTLTELGDQTASAVDGRGLSPALAATRFLHRSYFEAKFWFKCDPVMRALRPALTSAEIDASVLAEDHAPELRSSLPGLS